VLVRPPGPAAAPCAHLDEVRAAGPAHDPSDDGCHECLRTGRPYRELRMCQTCGHVGCCDSSPGRHAAAHHARSGHPLVRSFEPGEDWYWCYADERLFEVPGESPAPSRT
jgi:hypothetical protein